MMLKILNNLGNALYPAHLTLRNDIGHGGGPASLWGYWKWQIPVELTSFTATTQFGIVNLIGLLQLRQTILVLK